MAKKKILLVGESWVSTANHVKGWDTFSSITYHLGAEPLGLCAQVVHQVRTHDPLREPGEVLDVGGVHQRPTGSHRTLEDQRAQRRPGGVDRGRVPGWTGAHDDQIPNLGHVSLTPRSRG